MSIRIGKQLSERRRSLTLSQDSIGHESGMSQQQYQRVEAGGVCKTDTLERICDSMNLEVALIPKEKAELIQAILNAQSPAAALRAATDLVESSMDSGNVGRPPLSSVA